MEEASKFGQEVADELLKFWQGSRYYDAVWWYGYDSLGFGIGPFLAWGLFNFFYDVLPLEMMIYANLFAWTPVYVCFIINQYYFDDAFFRMLFRYSVIISVIGVYVGYWIGITFQVISMTKLQSWHRQFPLFLLAWNVIGTFAMMYYQLQLVPMIFAWIDEAPFGDKGAYDFDAAQKVKQIVD